MKRKAQNSNIPAKRAAIAEAAIPQLPKNETYAVSFQHNGPVTHILVADPCDFVVSLSTDGVIKFWKRRPKTIEFVKSYRAHLNPVRSAALSVDGSFVATVGEEDKSIKIFNVLDFDLLCKHDLDFQPLGVFFLSVGGASDAYLAVSDEKSKDLWLFPPTAPYSQKNKFTRHTSPVHLLQYSPLYKFIISTDLNGGIEYWIPSIQAGFPAATETSTQGFIQYRYKTDTDLYEMQKNKTHALALKLSPRSRYFALLCRDSFIRIYNTRTGKVLTTIDESLPTQKTNHEAVETSGTAKFSSLEFQRRCAMEEEFNKSSAVYKSNLAFDPSESFLIYPSILGIKVVNLLDLQVVAIVGKRELGLRYMAFDLSFGVSKLLGMDVKSNESSKDEVVPETLLIAAAFKRNQVVVFNHSSDTQEGSRDVRQDVEELPAIESHVKTSEQSKTIGAPGKSDPNGLIRAGNHAVINTTYGDIRIRLFPQECPRTVENFCVHAQKGYFDGLIFHRVIRNFMIQTGDPLGDGTGGQSIWGGDFEDEFSSELSHDSSGTVSMANAGPNTNSSQFFITTVPTPFLDGKHAVFGKVTKGLDVVKDIEAVKTNLQDRPLKDIKIMGIKILAEKHSL